MKRRIFRVLAWLVLAPVVVFILLWISGTLWATDWGRIVLAASFAVWVIGSIIWSRRR